MSNQISEAVEQFSSEPSPEDYIYDLARSAAKGDEAALEGLLADRHFTMVVRSLCLAVVRHSAKGSYQDARDLEQSVYIQVWRRLPSSLEFTDRRTFYSWLHQIAFHSYLDTERSLRSMRDTETVVAERDLVTSENQTINVALEEAISELDFRSRIVLGKWAAGVSAEEIARELGVSVKTVYRTINKIQKSLAARIEHPIPSVDWDALLKKIVESQEIETIFDESLAEIEEIRSRMQQVQSDIDQQKATTRSMIAELGFA
ncbi:MAG TPA: RNA polymerase sigma factor [Blastocatellia bacterium]|nr:RNA polymerase sigma factor [Blastocatellia bacterium]